MWTYDNPMLDPKDQVRFLIGDVNSNRPMFQDEEILWAMSVSQNVYTCAADLLEQFLTRVGGGGSTGAVKSKKIGSLTITYDIQHLTIVAGQMRARGMGHQIPYAGGISVADKEAQKIDTDWTQPSIQRGLDENPTAPQPSVTPSSPLTDIRG